MLNFKKQFVFLIAITAIFAGSFGFIDNVEAEYVSTSTITSADLISESNVSSIDSFYYNATSIPSGTSLEFQFATSSNSGPWYNSSGSAGSWDTVSTTGGDTIDLSSLNWSANSFYYKMRMTSDGTSTPVLDNIKVNYTIDYSGLFTMDKTSGYIGIGTTSPSSLFTVGSSGNFQVNDTGQVTSGTWQGDLISSTYGGTGWDSSAVTGIPIINSGTWSSTSTINDSYISDTLTLSTSSSVAKGALINTGTLSFDWLDSEIENSLTIDANGSVQAEAIDQEGATTGQVLEWNGTNWQPATDDDTTYSAGNDLDLSGTTFSLEDDIDVDYVRATGASGLSLYDDGGNGIFIEDGGNVGIGTTSPNTRFHVAGTSSTSTFDGGVEIDSGAVSHSHSTGITSIDELQLGAISFEADAGKLSWVDMPVTASSSVGTVQSYTAQLDGNPLLTVYGESDGSGSIQNKGIGIGTTSPNSLFHVGSASGFQVNNSGQVTSGTWQGDLVSSTYGGTGWDSSSVTGIPIINSGIWSSTSTINDSYISDTLTLSTSSSVAKGALTNTGTLSFDWVDSEVADNLTINTSGSVQAEAIDQEGASTGQVLEWNGTSWQPATDDDTTYSAGDYLTLSGTTFNVTDSWWDSVSDVPTATPSDGDTTHLSTADHIYDFVTGQGYLTDYQDLGYVNSNAPTGNYATHTVTISNGTNAIIYDYYDPDTNTTYSAGNDLDLSGTTFNIESTLDFVSTINLDGTGSITGLDSIDATTENTLESALDHDDLTGFVANEHIDHSSVSISGGTGLTGGGDITSSRTLSHADTSSQASSDNSGNTFIQDISLDGYGHLTGLTTGSVQDNWVDESGDSMSGGLGIGYSQPASTDLHVDGSVGVGTTSPSSRLTVDGDLEATGTTTFNRVSYNWPGSTPQSGKILSTNDGSGTLSWVDSENMGGQWVDKDTYLHPFDYEGAQNIVIGDTTTSSAPVFLSHSGDSWINSGGKVGIGTNSPNSLLSVGSASGFQVNNSGQVTSGTWQGDLVSSTYGGTGWDSSSVTGIPIINSGIWSSTSTINDSYISDTLTLSTSSSVAKGALTNTGTLSFDWVDSEVADNLTINTSGSVQAEAIDQEGASTGQVLEWNGTSWQPATDDDTTYSAGDYLTLSGTTFNVTDSWWDSVSDVPTATPSDGDTTHLSTADHIYDFVTGQGYLTDYQDL